MRITHLLNRKRRDRELADELETHLRMHTEENLRAGMSRQEARRAALVRLGGIGPVTEDYRDTGGIPRLESFLRDCRIAFRMLTKTPGFTLVVVLTLALGIGANTAVFSVVNSVLLKPLPYPNPDQLMNVWRTQGNGWTGSVSLPDLRDWQQQNTAFAGISAFSGAHFALRTAAEPEAAGGANVSANFFDVMQVQPFAGRGFEPNEEAAGQNHVAVLSYNLWASKFGGDFGLIGRDIQMNGASYTVVGVMPKWFRYPTYFTDVWVPLSPTPDEQQRDAHDFQTVGRLRPGVSIDEAGAQLNSISDRLAAEYPDTDKNLGALLVPLRQSAVGSVHDGLLAVFAVVGLVFLIALANISTLVLSRATSRQREIAVRLALGATRLRLLQQFFIEGLLLALGGAALAALTAKWSVAGMAALGNQYLPDPDAIQPDKTVFAFALSLALVAAVLLSLVAAWIASRINVNETLKEGAQSVSAGGAGNRGRRLLVTVQVGAAFLLLIGAGAMIESLVRLSRIQPGFDPAGLLTMRLPLLSPKNLNRPASKSLDPVLSKIQAVPGVESAAFVTYLPIQNYGTTSDFQSTKKGLDTAPQKPWAEVRAISPDYFQTMRIPLLSGRWFTDADGPDSPGVGVVNRTFTNMYFPEGRYSASKSISWMKSAGSPLLVSWKTLARPGLTPIRGPNWKFLIRKTIGSF